MFEQTIETSATPHVTVAECLGRLVVRGSQAQRIAIRLKDGTDEADLEQVGESLTLTARADCMLTCPVGATLTVHTVRGGLKVREVQGPVAIGSVHGDVFLRAVGPTTLDQTHGSLSARGVAGDLRMETVLGNARVRDVQGQLSIGQIGGDLRAERLQGGMAVDQVGADVRLEPPFIPGATYRLNAGSNLRVHLPADASVRLSVRAGGRVRSRVPGLVLEKVNGETKGVMGAGEASLEAQVGGSVWLRPLEPEEESCEGLEFVAGLEGLGAQIEARVAEAIAEMETQFEEGLGRMDSEAIRRQVERVTDQALRATEQAASRARREAERAAQQARMRAERAERRWRRASGWRPRPKREPATDEERMQVLRLVEEGKITPEQAAELLAALEGR